MKKRYIKPTIIDLSIEGITGFGYGILSSTCDVGDIFTPGSCTGYGNAATALCVSGGNPTDQCHDGSLPTDGGSYCGDGSAANGRNCTNGPAVSGFNSYCYIGGSGYNYTITPDCGDGHTANYCVNGPTGNYCVEGNNNVGGFS